MQLAARLALTLAMVLPASAEAYEISHTPGGQPLRWPEGQVMIDLAFTPSPDGLDAETSEAAAGRMIDMWRSELSDMAVSLYSQPAGWGMPHDATPNVNQIRWAVDSRDPDIQDSSLARAFLTYRVSDGTILDIDVVINAVDFDWTVDVDGCQSDYDVEGALAHELGHSVGLAHSIGHPEATMYSTADTCEIEKRDLSEDDRGAIGELYQTLGPADGVDDGCPDSPTCPQGGGCAAGGGGVGWMACAAMMAGVGMLRRRRGWAAVALAGGLATPARADQVRYLSLTKLGDRSDLVVTGRVIERAAASDQRFAIDTTIQVEECIAGDCEATVTVRTRGGEQDGIGLWVEGEAQFQVGDPVVVYLRRDVTERLRVVGGRQGVLRMVGLSGLGVAMRDLRELALVGAEGDDGPIADELEVFDLGEIRRALRRP